MKISKEVEIRLRRELDFLKSYLQHINHISKYHLTLQVHAGVNLSNVSENFHDDLNKIKMAIIREIGRRRKNCKLLGIKKEFPGDL